MGWQGNIAKALVARVLRDALAPPTGLANPAPAASASQTDPVPPITSQPTQSTPASFPSNHPFAQLPPTGMSDRPHANERTGKGSLADADGGARDEPSPGLGSTGPAPWRSTRVQQQKASRSPSRDTLATGSLGGAGSMDRAASGPMKPNGTRQAASTSSTDFASCHSEADSAPSMSDAGEAQFQQQNAAEPTAAGAASSSDQAYVGRLSQQTSAPHRILRENGAEQPWTQRRVAHSKIL